LLDYPESERGDEYKYMAIKSYFRYADHSVIGKQKKRFQKVVSQFRNFEEFYPNSSYLKEAKSYYHSAKKNIRSLDKLRDQIKKKKQQQHEPLEKIRN